MGRWTHYDSDAHRLPEGMKRIAYDADTRRYTFRDSEGAVWEGSPGAEFGGEMRRISGLIRRPTENDKEKPMRVTPNAPIPVPGKEGKPVCMGLGSTFRDFLPDNKIAQAAPLLMPPPQRSRWILLREKYSLQPAKIHHTVQQVLGMKHRAAYAPLEKEEHSSRA